WNLWALFALAAAFNLMFRGPNVGGGVVWIYVSSAVGWAVPDRKWAVRAVFGVAACYLFIGWLGHDDISDMLITLIPVIFVGITMSGFWSGCRKAPTGTGSPTRSSRSRP